MSEGTQVSRARRVEPRLARGMQDHLPARQAARQAVMDVVRRVYETHGFLPLATPAIEHLDVLLGPGGEEANASVFRVDSREDDALGLRFDLTVPLARFVAASQQDLPRPFRRYQVGPVWRLDKPGPGRFREFVQMDADIVGTQSALADAEVTAALRDVFAALLPPATPAPAARRWRIRFSDRRLLDALVARVGVAAERGPEIFRVLDKLDRVGLDKVCLELTAGYRDESGDRIAGLGLPEAAVTGVRELLGLRAGSRRGLLAAAAEWLGDAGSAAVEAVGAFLDLLEAQGVHDHEAELDLSLARGLAYYTGPVFEVELLGAEWGAAVGSVGGGGRYDDLVGRFSGQPWPGVGVSVGLDRLIAALELASGLAALGARPGPAVLVTVMDRKRLPEYVAMARELRAAGIATDLFTGGGGSFGKQLKQADRLAVPVAVIAGGDEMKKGVVTIKRMDEAEPADAASRDAWLAARFGQREVPREDLVAAVREALAHGGGAAP